MLGVQSAGPVSVACESRNGLRVAEAPAGADPTAAPRTPLRSRVGGRAVDAAPEGRAAQEAEEEREAWVVLLAVPGLGPITLAALLAAFGSARAALAAAAGPHGAVRLQEAVAACMDEDDRGHEADGPSPTDPDERAAESGSRAARRPSSRGLIGADLAERIRRQVADADAALAVVRALNLAVVTLDDPEYPDRLRRVDMPPPLLFVRGSLEALRAPAAVAVVGTRWPTDKGRLIAGWIGSALARAGAVVVSGLAVGIDGAAHAAVVAEGMPTVALLGGGHARLFPRAHERLADAIVAAGGAVVAELPPETPATRGTFPRRNRLVSGLSDATVVVEAGRRSGALITAGWALEQGRECFLVPGPLDAPTSEGCHAFLRSFPGQTRVVCGIPELIEDLGLGGEAESSLAAPDRVPVRGTGGTGGNHGPGGTAGGSGSGGPVAVAARPRSSRPGPEVEGAGAEAVLAALAPVERSVAELLTSGPATADDLALRSGLAVAAILSALTLLELRGLVVGAYGRYVPAGALARWPGRRRAQGRGPSVRRS
jgi:DNA processing protein